MMNDRVEGLGAWTIVVLYRLEHLWQRPSLSYTGWRTYEQFRV